MHSVARLVGMLVLLALPMTGRAFANVQPGEVVENAERPTLDGGSAHLLGPGRASVFVFFRPGHENSQATLEEIARCEKDFKGKPVYWVAVVSGRYDADSVRAEVRRARLGAPVLVDKDDALYGKLGLKLHPTVGIVDGARRLVAYLPFAKINYCDKIRAYVRHVLGEIDDAQLQAVLSPEAARQGGSASVARRYVNFAKRQQANGNLEAALESAQKAVDADDSVAAAHAMLGAVLAARGDCAKAGPEIERALALDPADETAAEARKTCGSAGTRPAEGKGAAKPAPEPEAKPEPAPPPRAEEAPAKPANEGAAASKELADLVSASLDCRCLCDPRKTQGEDKDGATRAALHQSKSARAPAEKAAHPANPFATMDCRCTCEPRKSP